MAIDTETMQLIERIVARAVTNATSLKGAADEITKGVTQYVGARYVPLFADPLEWDKTKDYEPLTIVLHQGNSYTSRQYVPVGVEIDNDSFWALTGNYNAQVEQYRQEVKTLDGRVTANENAIETETTNRAAAVTAEMERARSAERVLTNNLNAEVTRAEGAEQTLQANIDTKVTYFQSVEEMKNANNLKEGDTVKTNSYYSDGKFGGSYYKISSNFDSTAIDCIACKNNLVAKLIEPDIITPELFGAKADGVYDDTEAILNAIEYAQVIVKGSAMHANVYLHNGTYTVTRPLSTNFNHVTTLNIKALGTTSIVNVNSDFAFNDDNTMQFCLFDGIKFIGTGLNTFFNQNGGGQSQHVSFYNCTFQKFKTIMNCIGGAGGSENIFFNCRINACGSAENPCELFIVNNPQAVNWNFISTHIESFQGICFKIYKSITCNMNSCSIIPFGNSVIFDYTDAMPDYFGPGNTPTFNLEMCRYELHGKSILLDYGGSKSNVSIVHSCCGMGGYNLDETTETVKGNVAAPLHLTFNNCTNFEKHVFKIYNITSTLDFKGFIRFNGCGDLPTVNSDASTYSYLETLPILYIDNVPYPCSITSIHNVSATSNTIGYIPSTESKVIMNNKSYVKAISVLNTHQPASGSVITITDSTNNKQLATFTLGAPGTSETKIINDVVSNLSVKSNNAYPVAKLLITIDNV